MSNYTKSRVYSGIVAATEVAVAVVVVAVGVIDAEIRFLVPSLLFRTAAIAAAVGLADRRRRWPLWGVLYAEAGVAALSLLIFVGVVFNVFGDRTARGVVVWASMAFTFGALTYLSGVSVHIRKPSEPAEVP